ncbi:hypothetical protein H4W27_002089 [Nesterenkonia lutea]|uniref:Uncharacterized protein n=1 Tax=Nesterenkonia lutea TaxID=272919 RepID=A0ABR9JGB5_9MICC|nr:hypothetical protein [Nesterenkonia lutea]
MLTTKESLTRANRSPRAQRLPLCISYALYTEP